VRIARLQGGNQQVLVVDEDKGTALGYPSVVELMPAVREGQEDDYAFDIPINRLSERCNKLEKQVEVLTKLYNDLLAKYEELKK